MSDPGATPAWWRSPRPRIASWFALAFAVSGLASRASGHIDSWLLREFGDQDWMLSAAWTLTKLTENSLRASYGTTLFFATVFTVLGFGVRSLARSRARAGLRDPLERVRKFVASRPRTMRAVVVVPALVWGALLTLVTFSRFHVSSGDSLRLWSAIVGGVLPAAATFIAQTTLLRRGIRALVAPTTGERDVAEVEMEAEGFAFDAVAVTFETRAAVAAMAAFPFVFLTVLGLAGRLSIRGQASDLALIAAYIAITAGATALFTRASRIAVGVDGVLVKGSSRTRFFAYRDVDGARTSGADIELYRGSHVVLRLQLHGKDAARREALATRLQAVIARAHAEREDPVASFVTSASTHDLANAAGGGGDYRRPAVSRDQLWSLLEGPAIDTASRRAAAEALANTRDDSDVARLRVVASQCAEPAVRTRIEELLETEPEESDAPVAPALRRRALE